MSLTLKNNPHGAGVLVSAMPPESTAAAAGLNVGDIILSINGTLAADHKSAVAIIDSPGDIVSLVLSGEAHICRIPVSPPPAQSSPYVH